MPSCADFARVELWLAAAAISTCTPSEEPAAAAVSHHCRPVSGGVAARAHCSKAGVLALGLAQVQALKGDDARGRGLRRGAASEMRGQAANASRHSSISVSR